MPIKKPHVAPAMEEEFKNEREEVWTWHGDEDAWYSQLPWSEEKKQLFMRWAVTQPRKDRSKPVFKPNLMSVSEFGEALNNVNWDDIVARHTYFLSTLNMGQCPPT